MPSMDEKSNDTHRHSIKDNKNLKICVEIYLKDLHHLDLDGARFPHICSNNVCSLYLHDVGKSPLPAAAAVKVPNNHKSLVTL